MKKESKSIVFYDAECAFCRRAKKFLEKYTIKLEFEDINSKKTEEIFKENDIVLDKTSFWIKDESVFAKESSAIKRTSKYFRCYLKPYFILSYLIPNFILDFFYKKLAKKVLMCKNNKNCK